MKAYTDIEQSKKLAEILPLESADMHYVLIDTDKNKYSAGLGKYIGILPHYPCWSLAALLDILNEQDFTIKAIGNQFNIDIPIRHCKIWFSSLLDAAFEMVYWLKENEKI